MKILFKLLLLGLIAVSIAAAQERILVGGSVLNGDFNAPGNIDNVSFAATPEWQNIGIGDQSTVCLRNDVDYDGTHNAVVAETATRIQGLATGYMIQLNDIFSVSYVWKGDWQWNQVGDQIMIRLFTTDDDTIDGTPTDLVTKLSGVSTIDDQYESVLQKHIYHATAEDTGKRLFVAIDTFDGGDGDNGFARLDNFQLTVKPFRLSMTFEGTDPEMMTLSWPSLVSRYYTLSHSTDLSSWSPLIDHRMADVLEQSEQLEVDASAERSFYRVALEDDPGGDDPGIGAMVDPETPVDAQPFLNTPTADNWVLDFSDEFSGTAVDSTKWNIDDSSRSRAARPTQGIDDWWWKPANVSVSGGNLVLDVIKHDWNTMYCGSINSNDKYEPTYGYLEARIEVADSAKSTHTAFWLQGDNMNNVDGTGNDGAEVDIFESAWTGDYTKSVVHIDGYGSDHRANTVQYQTPGLHDGYHVFGLLWTENSMKIYYDGVLKVTYTGIWVPQVPERLWLSDGASFGTVGTFTSEAPGWLTSAKVDYVRVWKSR